MINASKNKLRMLYILDILRKETDDSHIISSRQIAEKLELYGITVERKSIYADINSLQDYGYDINVSHSPKGFYMGEREFELPEIRLMADAIQSANFISAKKTNALLKKLERYSSKYDIATMKEQVYVDKVTKTSNEEIYYTIDKINTAVKNKKQIMLLYCQRKPTDNFTARNESKEFNPLNPYAMIWSNDHYYLIANNPKYNNLMHLRIDKIKQVEILNTPVRPVNEVSAYKTKINLADYISTHFNMFSGEIQPVEIVFDKNILDSILDRFGTKTKIKVAGEDKYEIKINAAVSDGLVSWILQYGDKIKVKSPKILSTKVKERCKEILSLYEND